MQWKTSLTGLEPIWWLISVVLAVCVAITLFVLLRRYEAKLIDRKTSLVLLMLRVAVLVLLLIVFLEPTLLKTWERDKQRRLVVGFDVSASMETVDSHASLGEMLRWGQALGMVGNNLDEELLLEWQNALDQGLEPNWAGDGSTMVGAGRKDHVEEVFAEFKRMPRLEFVRRLLQSAPNRLLEELGDSQTVDLRVFGGEQLQQSPEQLAALLETARKDLVPSATDAVGMMSKALTEPEGGRVDGFVLFTDGRQTLNASADQIADLQSLRVPVYCIPIGSARSPRDLSIASLQGPESVFLDDEAEVAATISSTGYEGEEVTVELLEGDEVVDQRTIDVVNSFFDLKFAIPSDKAGVKEYRLRVVEQPDELRDDNNDRSFSVTVDDNKADVMLVDGESRWEFRYLHNALVRDKRVGLTTVLFGQPYLGLLNQPFMERSLPSGAELSAKLAATDILIFGDVAPSDVPVDFWPQVEQAVSDDGLTVVFLAGRSEMPFAYNSEEFTALLPVLTVEPLVAERFRASPTNAEETQFRLQRTAASKTVTFFEFSPPGDANPMTFEGLPGHLWACSGEPKPAANVWANLVLRDVELSQDRAGIVHQYYGFGQTLWMGIDSTWRWRRRAGDRWHHRFWGQLVRWAAQSKSSAGNDEIRLNLSAVVADDTETIDATVRWQSRNAAAVEDVPMSLEVVKANEDGEEDSVVQSIELGSVEGARDRFSGQIAPLPPGRYTVRLKADSDQWKPASAIESTLVIEAKPSTELADISCNREFLQMIAGATGGEVLEPYDLDQLAALVAPEDLSESKVEPRTLWDTWPAMILFFVLLGAEWIIRKVNGLP